MTNHKIAKITAVPPLHRQPARTLNQISERINRGHVVDTQTVIAKRLADGRVQLFLHPDIRKLFV